MAVWAMAARLAHQIACSHGTRREKSKPAADSIDRSLFITPENRHRERTILCSLELPGANRIHLWFFNECDNSNFVCISSTYFKLKKKRFIELIIRIYKVYSAGLRVAEIGMGQYN